jgi:hypothetical protein
MRLTGHVAHERDEDYIQSLVGKTKGKRPFGKSKHRSENNTKMDLKETG